MQRAPYFGRDLLLDQKAEERRLVLRKANAAPENVCPSVGFLGPSPSLLANLALRNRAQRAEDF